MVELLGDFDDEKVSLRSPQLRRCGLLSEICGPENMENTSSRAEPGLQPPRRPEVGPQLTALAPQIAAVHVGTDEDPWVLAVHIFGPNSPTILDISCPGSYIT